MFEFRPQASRKKFVFVGGGYFMIRGLKFKPFTLSQQHKSTIKPTDYGEGISTLRL